MLYNGLLGPVTVMHWFIDLVKVGVDPDPGSQEHQQGTLNAMLDVWGSMWSGSTL